MAVVVTVGELAIITTVVIFIVIILFSIVASFLLNIFRKLFMKNCCKCKYYYLKDVAGAGDKHWNSCRMFKQFVDERSSTSEDKYRFCKFFEEDTND